MKEIESKVKQTLIRASTVFSDDKKAALRKAIAAESNPNAKWVLETILENAETAETTRHPLCDDTGIPHVLLEVGGRQAVTAPNCSAPSSKASPRECAPCPAGQWQ